MAHADTPATAARQRRTVLGLIAGGAAAASLPALLRGLPRQTEKARPAGELKSVRPGYITVASTGDMPMFAVRNGQPVGADADMMRRIAGRLGLELSIEVMEWSACLASVPSGRADLVGGNMAWTEKRATAMILTDELYYTSIFAAMTEDKPFSDKIRIADMAGYSVGTGSGFSMVPDLRNVPGTRELKLYDTIDAAVRDVAARRLDFAFLDGPIVDYMIQQSPALKLKQVPLAPDNAYPVIGRVQHSVWGMNPANLDLFDAVNQGIAWLWRTGQIAEAMKPYGLTNPSYLAKPLESARTGFDRDDQGQIAGRFKHVPADFSRHFA